MSILTPVYDPPEDVLASCIASVLAQRSPQWEWCIVDDASKAPHVWPQLLSLAEREPRVRLQRNDSNGGIVAASNKALDAATGDIVVFLDHDDELVDNAVEEVLAAFAADPSLGIAYSDEYLIDRDGEVVAPYDKPDFSPERLRGHNYFCHLVAVRRDYAVGSGGLHAGFDGAQDSDFDFRAVEHFGRAGHIPKRLYRWRAISGSVASDPASKPATLVSAERALREHLERTGSDARTTPVRDINFSFRLHRTPHRAPLVSIVSRQSDGRVVNAVGEALRLAEYSNIELIPLRDDLVGAAAVNRAVEDAQGAVLLIVDADVEIHHGDLMGELVPLAQETAVASVGPSIYLADGRLAANGLAFDGRPSPVGLGSDADNIGPWGIFRVTREVSAVPTTCFAVRRDRFIGLGGLDESLPYSLVGADYGMRARRRDLRILVTPFAGVTMPSSAMHDVSEQELGLWSERWSTDALDERFSV